MRRGAGLHLRATLDRHRRPGSSRAEERLLPRSRPRRRPPRDRGDLDQRRRGGFGLGPALRRCGRLPSLDRRRVEAAPRRARRGLGHLRRLATGSSRTGAARVAFARRPPLAEQGLANLASRQRRLGGVPHDRHHRPHHRALPVWGCHVDRGDTCTTSSGSAAAFRIFSKYGFDEDITATSPPVIPSMPTRFWVIRSAAQHHQGLDLPARGLWRADRRGQGSTRPAFPSTPGSMPPVAT